MENIKMKLDHKFRMVFHTHPSLRWCPTPEGGRMGAMGAVPADVASGLGLGGLTSGLHCGH